MNTIREIERLNALELSRGVSDAESWHASYRGCAWVYVGGLDAKMTEGDVLAVFSQWGEIEDIHLVRDEASGRSKGFAFLKYSDWRSCVLAVDNMNGVNLLGRVLRVDHKRDYEPPRKKKDEEDVEQDAGPRAHVGGHAYAGVETANAYSFSSGVDVWARAEEQQREKELREREQYSRGRLPRADDGTDARARESDSRGRRPSPSRYDDPRASGRERDRRIDDARRDSELERERRRRYDDSPSPSARRRRSPERRERDASPARHGRRPEDDTRRYDDISTRRPRNEQIDVPLVAATTQDATMRAGARDSGFASRPRPAPVGAPGDLPPPKTWRGTVAEAPAAPQPHARDSSRRPERDPRAHDEFMAGVGRRR